MEVTKKKKLLISIPQELFDELIYFIKELNVSKNILITQVLEFYFDEFLDYKAAIKKV
ncbi:MAG: hypothetical protein ACK5LP_03640 [Campylobacteraceae bacterium]